MKITSERKPDSQVLLEISVEPERVERSVDQAYRRLSGKYRIPGFRPGKAPRVMFERYVGRETLMREALERLVPEIYEEAVKEEALDPIDQPQFEISTVEPLLIKATVPLRPSPDLKDYRLLRVEREETAVDPEEVEKNLEDLRRRYATLQPVERPIRAGDIVRLDIIARANGREFLNETDLDLRLSAAGTMLLPGLLDKLPGCEKGESYDFETEVPGDNDAGVTAKTVAYHLEIKEVKEEQLPEPNDDFAREVGEGFESFTALRERLEEDVRKRARDESDREFEQKVIEALIGQSTLEYPPVLTEREIDHIISEQTGGGSRANVDVALRSAGRTEAEYRDELRPLAKERVERSLALTELARREGINVDAAEVESELDRLAGPSTPQYARMREMLGTKSGLEFLERKLLTRKVYERLRDIAQGKELPPVETVETSAGLLAGDAPQDTGDARLEALETLTTESITVGREDMTTKGRDIAATADGTIVSADAVEAAQAEV